jgi:hypothetical protein
MFARRSQVIRGKLCATCLRDRRSPAEGSGPFSTPLLGTPAAEPDADGVTPGALCGKRNEPGERFGHEGSSISGYTFVPATNPPPHRSGRSEHHAGYRR